MVSRNGQGYFDVRVNGQVVGFVTGPDAAGKWHAYVDVQGKNSKRVGSYGTRAEAVSAVESK